MTNVEGAYAHAGFLTAYNSVAPHVISVVKSQLAAHPDYTIVSTGRLFTIIHNRYLMLETGHSLGGSLASIASLSLKANLPANATVKLYTFGRSRSPCEVISRLDRSPLGQPRTGNSVYASLVETALGDSNIFRGTFLLHFRGCPLIFILR